MISDVDMPRMNGFELCRKVRANKKLTELPIILITSLSTREDREQGIDTGALAVVKRPPDLHHPQHKEMRKELLQTVKLMSEVKVVIVQHITKEFITGLQEWLSGTSSIMCLPRQKLRS